MKLRWPVVKLFFLIPTCFKTLERVVKSFLEVCSGPPTLRYPCSRIEFQAEHCVLLNHSKSWWKEKLCLKKIFLTNSFIKSYSSSSISFFWNSLYFEVVNQWSSNAIDTYQSKTIKTSAVKKRFFYIFYLKDWFSNFFFYIFLPMISIPISICYLYCKLYELDRNIITHTIILILIYKMLSIINSCVYLFYKVLNAL